MTAPILDKFLQGEDALKILSGIVATNEERKLVVERAMRAGKTIHEILKFFSDNYSTMPQAARREKRRSATAREIGEEDLEKSKRLSKKLIKAGLLAAGGFIAHRYAPQVFSLLSKYFMPVPTKKEEPEQQRPPEGTPGGTPEGMPEERPEGMPEGTPVDMGGQEQPQETPRQQPIQEEETSSISTQDLITALEELAGLSKRKGKKGAKDKMSRAVASWNYNPEGEGSATITFHGKKPGTAETYFYNDVSPEEAEILNTEMNRKTSGKNWVGSWEQGTPSPAGASASQFLLTRRQRLGLGQKDWTYRFPSKGVPGAQGYDAWKPYKTAHPKILKRIEELKAKKKAKK